MSCICNKHVYHTVKDITTLQITRDAVPGALNECEIDVSGTPLYVYEMQHSRFIRFSWRQGICETFPSGSFTMW